MTSVWLIAFLISLLFNEYTARIYRYKLPDDSEIKSLYIYIDTDLPYTVIIHVHCYNYDSLKYLEIRQGPYNSSTTFGITFFRCFNNETTNENYKYRLWDAVSSIPNYAEIDQWTGLNFALKEYAEVNSDTLLKNFNFTKFHHTGFRNIGFDNSRYVTHLKCSACIFSQMIHFDLNDIRDNMVVNKVQFVESELINFNKKNMKKFNNITRLRLYRFSLAHHNALNAARLFENNVNLEVLEFDKSQQKITLHEDVFRGLFHLTLLRLTNLQLDSIPEKLFSGLQSLREIFLNSNNIKTLHPYTFAHFNLHFIELKNNPIFTMPHDQIQSLPISADYLKLGNFTQHTLQVVEALINNPEISAIYFENLLADPIDVTQFTKIHHHRDRLKHLEIKFSNYDAAAKVALDMKYIMSHSIPKTVSILYGSDNKEEINIVVVLPIKESMCGDCWVMKQLLENFYEGRYNLPEFYFRQGGLLVQPRVTCWGQEYRFEIKFKKNCPTMCECRYNGLLDKILIFCNNRNLTEIPVIPYPEQFENIKMIDLHLEHNLLTNVTFDNQNPKVLEKLSTLLLQNNTIGSVSLPDVLRDALFVLNLCANRDLFYVANNEFDIAGGHYQYLTMCHVGSRYPSSPFEYINQIKSKAAINEYLDSFCLDV